MSDARLHRYAAPRDLDPPVRRHFASHSPHVGHQPAPVTVVAGHAAGDLGRADGAIRTAPGTQRHDKRSDPIPIRDSVIICHQPILQIGASYGEARRLHI
jgi:hypothetical protein